MVRILFLLTIIIGIGAAIFGLFRFLNNSPFTFNTSGAAVVKEIQKLNRLETASFTIEKVIDAGTKGNTFDQILFGDKILLIAHGKVTAGFDLSRLNENDITIKGSALEIRLPPPQILDSKLDNEQTRVYDRSQGLLTKGNKDLESEARKTAEMSIREAACNENILEVAAENGRKQLTTLFSTLKFTSVTISIPRGDC